MQVDHIAVQNIGACGNQVAQSNNKYEIECQNLNKINKKCLAAKSYKHGNGLKPQTERLINYASIYRCIYKYMYIDAYLYRGCLYRPHTYVLIISAS